MRWLMLALLFVVGCSSKPVYTGPVSTERIIMAEEVK